MFGLPTKAGGWLKLHNNFTRQVTTRGIATPSAIHRGLRRSKTAPEPSYGGRGRGSKPKDHDGVNERPTRKPTYSSNDRREHETRPAAGQFRATTKSSSFPSSGSQHAPGRYEHKNPEDRRSGSHFREGKKRWEATDRPRFPRAVDVDDGTSRRPGRDTSGLNTRRQESFDADGRKNLDRSSAYKKRDDEAGSDDKPYQKVKRADPVSVTYTTPASEFLYGTSVVHAALKADRRKHYKLYISSDRTKSASNDEILKLAKKRGLNIQRVSSTALLDKMSAGRPHNGVMLEASPLMRPPVESLLSFPNAGQSAIKYIAGKQSQEDLQVNGADNQFQAQSRNRRYPLVLLLDGVQDTGNMGGIIRTAHFLGVDAVIMSGTCAPLNAVVLKASAGAAETLPLLYVTDTSGFVQASQDNGWQFIASVAPPSPSEKKGKRVVSTHYKTDEMESPLAKSPCVLMIGGEGTGLMRDLVRKADASVSIESHRARKSTVDSLNVSVATGILVDAFLREVRTASLVKENDMKEGENEEEKESDKTESALF